MSKLVFNMLLPKTHLKELNRMWLHVTGSDAERFLNGMWTCDFKLAAQNTKPAEDRFVCGAGLLLNVKGKAITEAIFLCQGPNDFLISIPTQDHDATLEALNRLLVADDVDILTLKQEKQPFQSVFEVPNSTLLENADALSLRPLVSAAKDKLYFAQPSPWGLRIPRGLFGPQHEQWWVRDVLNEPFEFYSDHEWSELRIKAGIPEWGVDFGPENLPLEFPLFHEISFHKGCYIGQEVIARATYRGHMPRGWVRVKSKNQRPLEADFVYSTKDLEKPVGKLSTVSADQGLGLLRFAALEEGTQLLQKSGTQIDHVERLLPEKPLE